MVSSVKCNADEKQNDGKHDDASENFHGYSFPIWSMIRKAFDNWGSVSPVLIPIKTGACNC